jgi:hypothetical protein
VAVQDGQLGPRAGWDCQGDATVDYAGGRRGLDRGGGLGINHFDRDGLRAGSPFPRRRV